MSCPGGVWQAPRRRKSAAERRAQADRAEARTVCRLLKGLLSIEAHRGGQLSRAGRALLSSLQAAPPVVVVAAAAGPVHEGNEGVDNHEGDDPESVAPADGPPAAAFRSGSCGDLASLGHVAPSAASSSAADLRLLWGFGLLRNCRRRWLYSPSCFAHLLQQTQFPRCAAEG